MAKRVWVVDSNGNSTRQRMGWVRRQTGGEWINGAYVFRPADQQRHSDQLSSVAILGAPGSRAATLFGRQWKDTRDFPVDPQFWDGRGVLRFWADQSSSHGKIVALDGRRA